MGFTAVGGVSIADGLVSNVVDLYNSASGKWSTAQLSVARSNLAATSVANVAIFAGGEISNCFFALFVEGLLFWLMSVGDAVTFACLRRVACCLLCLRCRRLPSHGGYCRYPRLHILRYCIFQCRGLVQLYIGPNCSVNNSINSITNNRIRITINNRSSSAINRCQCGCCSWRICGRRHMRRSAGCCRVALAEISIPGT